MALCGFGPTCPECSHSAEWTDFEIRDPVYAPKVYTCSNCFTMYSLSVEEIQNHQNAAQQALAECDDPQQEETEADWQRARYEWDNPDRN